MAKFRITASSLNVRTGPSINDLIITALPRNTLVEPIDVSLDERWYQIEVQHGGNTIRGWISKGHLAAEETEPIDPPRWFTIAEGEIGVSEVAGPGNNLRIVQYHQSTTLRATEDSVPWCSSFVNFCVEKAGIPGTDSASARSWLSFGRKLDTSRLGCIVVLRRGPNPNNGHVGFFAGESASHLRLLGGNQSDQVKFSNFPKSMLLTYRWPANEL
jgi:uncharacterized protein (TIGR02594 family)